MIQAITKQKFQCRAATLVVLSLSAFAGSSWAQREVLSPDQLAAYKQQLPQAITTTTPTAFKSTLQRLQNTPAPTREIANAVRVAQDARAANLPANAYFAHYSVPAMSHVMRLPDEYPLDGELGAELGAVLAQDEYEPASFVLYPFADADKVELKVSDLKSADGSTLPAANLDLKVVKAWYQNGNGWFSYFQDVGLELVPELLVYDENLIRVDTQEKANYARVSTPQGSREVWISPPKKVDPGFDAYQPGFADAKTLQPVSFSAGQFKQFMLTVHAPTDARPGVYRGHIEVTAAGRPTSRLPVAVRVLPFALPAPAANYDADKKFIVGLMNSWPKVHPDHPAFLPILQNLRRHNVLHMEPGDQPGAYNHRNATLLKQAGFDTDFIFGGTLVWVGTHDATPLNFDDLMTLRRSARRWREFHEKEWGHTNVALVRGDEQGVNWIMKSRPGWRVVNREGMKTTIAGHQERLFAKAGFMLDIRPIAGFPEEADKPAQWNQIGNGHTGFYAGQHNGSENPSYVRRQHGLLGYLSGFDMVYNYEFAYGPWNDRATELYKPMVLAYPTSEGLVDTLAWEGFREGIDDIRYATKLRQLANEAIDSGNLDRIYAGREVRHWFAQMDGSRVDLNAVRAEMIEKIRKLMQLATPQQ